jgi:hypothetical protein
VLAFAPANVNARLGSEALDRARRDNVDSAGRRVTGSTLRTLGVLNVHHVT